MTTGRLDREQGQGGIAGRTSELQILSTFLESIPAGPAAIMLEGEPGIGKTTLWRLAIAEAVERRFRVLSASPAATETRLSFSGLRDLVDPVLSRLLPRIPEPEARSLEVALLLRPGGGHGVDRHAVSRAFLTILRTASTDGPVLLAIDDAQWLDRPSAAVLAFAARRLQREPIAFALFARTIDARPADFPIQGLQVEGRVLRLVISPLTVEALGRMLREKLGAALPRPTLGRLHQLSGGNPFVALELGRAVRSGAISLQRGEDLPPSIDSLVDHRIRALSAATRAVLGVAAATAEPTLEVLERVAGPGAEALLRPAIEADVISVEHGRIRFSHPLLASAAYGSVPRVRRVEIHRALAAVVVLDEERAWQLALSATAPDELSAAELERTAHAVRSRGAPDTAGLLMERAAALTGEESDESSRRQILAGRYHYEAGDTLRARSLMERAIREMPAGAQRAEALAQFGWISLSAGTPRARRLFEAALAEPGDDSRVRVSALRGLAWLEHQHGTLSAAMSFALSALDAAEHLAEPDALASALSDVVLLGFLMGRGIDWARLRRALELERQVTDHLVMLSRPSWVHGLVLEWTGELDRARSVLEGLYARAVEAGDGNAVPYVAIHLSRVAQRAGDWEAAERFIEEAEDATFESSQPDERAYVLATKALLDVQAGRIDSARSAIAEGLRIGDSLGGAPSTLEALSVLGLLELTVGDPPAAVVAFDRLIIAFRASGFADPGLNMRFHGDAIEAYLNLDQLEAAELLLVELEERATTLGRPWAIAVASRSRALLIAARGHPAEALAVAARALAEQAVVGEPFELGRSLLARGIIARRAKQRGLARASLLEAISVFELAHCHSWTARARAELGRVSGRARSGAGLTPAEERVTSLVASGLSNREAAARLFVTEHTVEAVLVSVYSKLGIRTRSELVGLSAAGAAPEPSR